MNFNIWEGVYDSFGTCPKCGDGFESERWVSQSLEKINKMLDAAKEKTLASLPVSCQTMLLPLLTAMLLEKSKNNKVSILDFGGGLGFDYITMINNCTTSEYIDYHIVESENICRLGENIFKDDEQIHFHTSLPNGIQNVNIVYISSSLQYVEDWKGLIYSLSQYNPQYFLFVDLPAGNIPTYATVQNYYESKIPHWFFNVTDIISEMSSVNLKLLFKSSFDGIYLGKRQKMPQENFPKEYQIGKSCNLLFYKEST